MFECFPSISTIYDEIGQTNKIGIVELKKERMTNTVDLYMFVSPHFPPQE